MDIPVFTVDRLWHIGSLIPEHRKAFSFEGHCLSASTTPNAWQKIAKISGEKHQIDVNNHCFVDAIAFIKNESLKNRLIQYGKKHHLIEQTTVYHTSWIDGETDETFYMTFLCYDEAQSEADCEDSIESNLDWIATDKLKQETGMTFLNAEAPFDALLIHFFEHFNHKYIVGIFWNELLDPVCLSAPRFALFSHTIENLDVKTTDNSIRDVVPEKVGSFKILSIDFL